MDASESDLCIQPQVISSKNDGACHRAPSFLYIATCMSQNISKTFHFLLGFPELVIFAVGWSELAAFLWARNRAIITPEPNPRTRQSCGEPRTGTSTPHRTFRSRLHQEPFGPVRQKNHKSGSNFIAQTLLETVVWLVDWLEESTSFDSPVTEWNKRDCLSASDLLWELSDVWNSHSIHGLKRVR